MLLVALVSRTFLHFWACHEPWWACWKSGFWVALMGVALGSLGRSFITDPSRAVEVSEVSEVLGFPAMDSCDLRESPGLLCFWSLKFR
jgi:hypothetical protein